MYNFDPYNVLLAIATYDCFCAPGTHMHTPSPYGKNIYILYIYNLSIYHYQCWAVTSYCNLVTVIILLFAVTSSVTNY